MFLVLANPPVSVVMLVFAGFSCWAGFEVQRDDYANEQRDLAQRHFNDLITNDALRNAVLTRCKANAETMAQTQECQYALLANERAISLRNEALRAAERLQAAPIIGKEMDGH
jgi:hypothetical protein